jgi:filamentous hemagglutinin family protein
MVKPLTLLNNQIEGGAIRGTNLFHSFEQFSVPTNGEAYFNNDLTIQNIISRVTGLSTSNIDGLIKTNGTANLFLLNPNGIIFGPKASLNIAGSFVASTALSINFADLTQFSATASQTTPLLTVSVPVGLQFGETTGSILNQSRVTNSRGITVGLQVQPSQTLALVGGEVALEGGYLTAEQGRIELGSVADSSQVSLNPTNQGWVLGYEGTQNFQDIHLAQQALINASGEGGGNIKVQGKRVVVSDGAQILATTLGSEPGGNLTVNASDSVELIGFVPFGSLSTVTFGAGNAGDLTITTKKLIVQDGAEALSFTLGQGAGGQLTVNASDSVELIGSSSVELDGTSSLASSGLFSSTVAAGNAGNLTITTRKLIVRDGAAVSAASATGEDSSGQNSITAIGRGGNLTVNASESVELIDGTLSTETSGVGDAGDLTIKTEQLIVKDRTEVAVKSQGLGDAGDIEVTAGSILLENQGELTATNTSGKGGGNVRLQDIDLLLMRRNGEISTNAGGSGNGGNINIDTNLLVGLENSDITATAIKGRGGNIQINTQGIFGIEPRSERTPESDITASSVLGIDGMVEINRPDIEPSGGLVTLPTELFDASRLIAQGCSAGGGTVARESSKFIATGRGGLPPTPTEALRSDAALADLGTPVQSEGNRASAATSSNLTNSKPTPLVEAQGWMIGSKGEVVLIAQAPTVTPHLPWLPPTSCNGS